MNDKDSEPMPSNEGTEKSTQELLIAGAVYARWYEHAMKRGLLHNNNSDDLDTRLSELLRLLKAETDDTP